MIIAIARSSMVWVRLLALSVVCAGLLSACGGSSASHTSTSRSQGASTSSVVNASASTHAKRHAPTRTSCRSVVYIGDSTSDGEASAEYVPNAKLREPAQLSKVGVRTTHMQVSGARSIHEIFENIPNAAMVARREVAAGFHGCWILALGTNEAADVAAGSTFGLRARINAMMSIIGHQPVMWINAITLPGTPAYYEEAGMRRWDHDLLAACAKYPTMRVFDWAAHAKPSWFISDHIHYTPQGYIQRTQAIAHALVKAFPSGQQQSTSSSEIVRAFEEAFPRNQPSGAGCLVH